VILVASPYSGGMMPYPQYDINVPLFVPGLAPAPAPPGPPPPISHTPYFGNETLIRDVNSGGYSMYFLPRGFIFADAQRSARATPPAVRRFNPVAQASAVATINQVTQAYQDPNVTFDPGGRLMQLVFRFNW
jgi:hypothetical protein